MRRDSNLVLIKKAKTGDYDSFGELVHRYSHLIYAISLKILHDFHGAEALSQEVFVKVWRNLGTLKEPKKFLKLAGRPYPPPVLKKELYNQMAEEFTQNCLDDTFEEEVMWRIVPRIATIEIPVSSISESVKWYSKYIGTKAVFQDDQAAMLQLQSGSRLGVPTLYLVQTNDQARLHFKNTNTSILHSVVDFYIQDLERYHDFLQSNGVHVTQLNFIPGMDGFGGFGFKDPDGNLLSATNVVHSGQ